MFKLSILLIALTLVGCNNRQPDATKYLTRGNELAKVCGDREEMSKNYMTGAAIIQSKEKAGIPFTESESEALSEMFVEIIKADRCKN